MPRKSKSHHIAANPSISTLLLNLWRHLKKRRQRQLLLLLLLMLTSAFSELITLGAVLPFIGVLTVPEKVFNYTVIEKLVRIVGITSPSQLVAPLVVTFALTALLAGSLRLLLVWTNAKLSNSVGADISIEMYRRTLYQPYKIHVVRNSSEVIDGITHKSWIAMATLQAVLTLASSTLLLIFLTIALVAIDPFVVSVAVFVFGVSYGTISWAARRKLKANSELIATESALAISALQEGLWSIRDVLLNWTQPFYCDSYSRADIPYRKAYGSNMFIAVSPRFAMEAIGMVLIAAMAYGLSRASGEVSTALPLLGALALGAQRIIPSLQQIYSAWVSITGNHASLATVIELLDQPIPPEASEPAPPPLQLNDSICFKSVWFRYLDSEPWVIKNFNLTIHKGSRMGFVGSTGSGKSTAMDLLMGLLEPTSGQILVDGLNITGKRLRPWQQSVAHVPQSIFLANSTLAENIALGLPRELIDMERVAQAARQAQIADFIESRPDGYFSQVGERGVMLSGGERQRIAIARALYKQASILVFDEATSSLDNETEQAVMECIENLDKELTILIIAHRLTTVQHCDQIVELADGELVAQGTYDELMETSSSFFRMASARAISR
ncbi:MAG: ABC transporter ATP-binding protein [Desulfomonilaceae bacterium]